MAQVSKTIIIYCLMIFHTTKSKKDSTIGFITSKQLENTLFHWFICYHTSESNFQLTIQQQWPNYCSSMKNSYYSLF